MLGLFSFVFCLRRWSESTHPPTICSAAFFRSIRHQALAGRAQLLHLVYVPIVLRAGESRAVDAEGDGQPARADQRDEEEIDRSARSLTFLCQCMLARKSRKGMRACVCVCGKRKRNVVLPSLHQECRETAEQ